MASDAPPEEISRPSLDGGSLYAVLLFRGDYTTWDWAFFVPDAAKTPIGALGSLFHTTQGSAGRWAFAMENSADFHQCAEAVAMVRLADLHGLGSFADVVQELTATFNTVDTSNTHPAEFSSRLWFIEAICVLHDCGFVTCDDAWLLERELKRYAFSAMDSYLEGGGTSPSVPFISLNLISGARL
ncbi:hypothetical protein BDZ89DRAFT_1062852 [Hymenopellis radicata]|nr:hypothetical protein BDZ89DRAFT_1062852 [Hymenopellis radicata]